MNRRAIKQLSADVARKIAAGEVIDRPAAIIRELLDNAVDSGADTISAEIEGGGIDKIRIVDNGCGMTQEDLAACARPHATSKISTETDLLNLTTLGFRGEALASIAAVSRLEITSGGYKMRASVTEDHIIEPSQPVKGTIVQSQALFENFPARRLFLKRPASETMMCRATFIEKTLPRPDISFRLTIDGDVKLDLPAGQTLSTRFVQALDLPENASLFYEITGKADTSSFRLVIGDPSVTRQDRKFIYIFVNGRRITEYSLMQAVEYGCQGYFPNGLHPAAALFVQIDPSQVDFNIHPAKKEARFQDISGLHHAVSTAVRDFFKAYTLKAVTQENREEESERQSFLFGNPDTAHAPHSTFSARPADQVPSGSSMSAADMRSRFFSPSSAAVPAQAEATDTYSFTNSRRTQPADTCALAEAAGQAAANPGSFKYIGSALGVFLIAEKDSTLYIIDQHAAHERILFNKIMETAGRRQKLLVPYVVETASSSDDAYLENIKDELEEAGYSVTNCGNGRWEFSSVPERWQGTEDDLSRALLDKRLNPGEIQYTLAATSACKAAVKDGYILDSTTAARLAREALDLPDPHCPHGRPIYTAITREQLFALVKRT